MMTPRWKLLTVSILSWVACVATVLSAMLVLEAGRIAVPDIIGAASATFAGSLVVITLLYLPGLFWLRRRHGGCAPVLHFPLTCAFVLNAPIFILAAVMAGGASVVAEAIIFMAAFLVLGASFGFGFVWSYRNTNFP